MELIFKESKNGYKIPVLNDVYLHSIYNPIKEAKTFVTNNLHQIKRNSKFLVLGLGYGYHINELVREVKDQDYTIYVVEPCAELIQNYKADTILSNKRIIIKELNSQLGLYQDEDFVDFLSEKPSILMHSTSFNMHQKIFKTFLEFQAPNVISEFFTQLDPQLQRLFLDRSDGSTLYDEIQIARNTIPKNTKDYLLLTLESMTRGEL
jgi:hypothetical protein